MGASFDAWADVLHVTLLDPALLPQLANAPVSEPVPASRHRYQLPTECTQMLQEYQAFVESNLTRASTSLVAALATGTATKDSDQKSQEKGKPKNKDKKSAQCGHYKAKSKPCPNRHRQERPCSLRHDDEDTALGTARPVGAATAATAADAAPKQAKQQVCARGEGWWTQGLHLTPCCLACTHVSWVRRH